jgi:hypothetical protein
VRGTGEHRLGLIGSWLSFATASYTARVPCLRRLRDLSAVPHARGSALCAEAAITATMQLRPRDLLRRLAIAAGNATPLPDRVWRQRRLRPDDGLRRLATLTVIRRWC